MNKMFGHKLSRLYIVLFTIVFFIASCVSNAPNITQNDNKFSIKAVEDGELPISYPNTGYSVDFSYFLQAPRDGDGSIPGVTVPIIPKIVSMSYVNPTQPIQGLDVEFSGYARDYYRNNVFYLKAHFIPSGLGPILGTVYTATQVNGYWQACSDGISSDYQYQINSGTVTLEKKTESYEIKLSNLTGPSRTNTCGWIGEPILITQGLISIIFPTTPSPSPTPTPVPTPTPTCHPGTWNGTFNIDGTPSCCPQGAICSIGGTPLPGTSPNPTSQPSVNPTVTPVPTPTVTTVPSASPTNDPNPTPTPTNSPEPTPTPSENPELSVNYVIGTKQEPLKGNFDFGTASVQEDREFSVKSNIVLEKPLEKQAEKSIVTRIISFAGESLGKIAKVITKIGGASVGSIFFIAGELADPDSVEAPNLVTIDLKECDEPVNIDLVLTIPQLLNQARDISTNANLVIAKGNEIALSQPINISKLRDIKIVWDGKYYSGTRKGDYLDPGVYSVHIEANASTDNNIKKFKSIAPIAINVPSNRECEKEISCNGRYINLYPKSKVKSVNCIVYRSGGKTPKTFTPRNGVDDQIKNGKIGLSTFTIDSGKDRKIDVSKLSGNLYAIQDDEFGHVSIRPGPNHSNKLTDSEKIQISEWALTRNKLPEGKELDEYGLWQNWQSIPFIHHWTLNVVNAWDKK